MTEYRLYVLHASLVPRSHAPSLWAEADRMRALALQQGVVAALMDLDWIVDVDDSEADLGRVRLLMWGRTTEELVSIANAMPLGYLKLLEVNAVELAGADSVRAWLDQVREDRGMAPAPPAADNVFAQLLEIGPRKDLVERVTAPGSADADKVLVCWAMYRARDAAVRERYSQARAEDHDFLLESLRQMVESIRACAQARTRLRAAQRNLTDFDSRS